MLEAGLFLCLVFYYILNPPPFVVGTIMTMMTAIKITAIFFMLVNTLSTNIWKRCLTNIPRHLIKTKNYFMV